MIVQFIIWMATSLVLQMGLNWLSHKINYGYSKKMQVLAVVLNAIVWERLSQLGYNPSITLIAVASTVMISIIFIDLKYYEIPNTYNAVIAVLGIAFVILENSIWLNLMLGGVWLFLGFFLLMVLTGGSVGGGDVKLVFGIGLFLGQSLLINFLMITFMSGALISLFLLVSKLKTKEDKIAFGPYICFSFIWIWTTQMLFF